MPELPEGEWLRRNLESSPVGGRFVEVSVTLPKLFVGGAGFGPDRLVGKRGEAVRRRAKFLLIDLSDDLALVFHLRMSGQVVQRTPAGKNLAVGGHPVPAFDAPLPHKATHAVFD